MYSITMKYWPVCSSLAGVEHLDDVGVHQPRGRLRLALEARHERRVVGEVLGEQLDGDLALQAQVEREVHGGHPAEAEPALQAVAPGDLHASLICRLPGRRRPPAPPPRAPVLRRAARLFPPPGPAARRASFACRSPGAGVPPPVPGVVVVRRRRGRASWAASWVVVGRRGGGRVRGAWSWRSCSWRSPGGAAGRRARARACAGLRCPGAALRRPASTRRGQRAEVLFGLRERGFGGEQLPSPFCAACATASKSLCSGPALAAGIRPLPELPQETSSAAATPSSRPRKAQGPRRRRRARRGVASVAHRH